MARYGGDEFVILMPETNIEQGHQFAEKLRAWIYSDPLLREKSITASFGHRQSSRCMARRRRN